MAVESWVVVVPNRPDRKSNQKANLVVHCTVDGFDWRLGALMKQVHYRQGCWPVIERTVKLESSFARLEVRLQPRKLYGKSETLGRAATSYTENFRLFWGRGCLQQVLSDK